MGHILVVDDEKELADLQRFINHKCQEVQRQQAEILS